jgi:hypothetical protein
VRRDGAYLVLPYYDLPGRLTGFLLVQHDVKLARHVNFAAISGYQAQRTPAGYFLLDSLLRPAPDLKNRQFILDDPFWVLREQCRQLRYRNKLLPLAAWYNGSEAVSYGQTWVSFGPADRIFQGAIATPELISQAAIAKGYVAVSPLDTEYRKNISYTMHCLGALCSRISTWAQTLRKTLAGFSEINQYAFASKLTVPHDKLQAFFEKYATEFSEHFRTRILRAIDVAPGAPTRAHNRWILLEEPTGWWNQRGQQICNARVIIQRVIQLDGGEKLYAGKIIMGDWELEFSDTATRIERLGLLAYAAAKVAPHQKLILYERTWNKRSHFLAMQLHPPEILCASTKRGWDAEAGVFRLGSYALTSSGEIAPNHWPELAKPGRELPEPTERAPITIQRWLDISPAAAFAWNIFADIVVKLLAPALNKDARATVLTAAEFEFAAQLADILHCRHEQTTELQRRSRTALQKLAAQPDDWPLLWSNRFDDHLIGSCLPRINSQPVLVRTAADSLPGALSYGCQSFVPPALPPIKDLLCFAYVLPAYIQHALKNRMALTLRHADMHVAVLHDLYAWLETQYGQTFNLAAALAQVRAPENAHSELMRALVAGIESGELNLLPRPRRRDQPNDYLLRRKTTWWLNQRAVDAYLKTDKNVDLNWTAIINLMSQEGVFHGEEEIHNLSGIVIAAAWCDQFYRPTDFTTQELG